MATLCSHCGLTYPLPCLLSRFFLFPSFSFFFLLFPSFLFFFLLFFFGRHIEMPRLVGVPLVFVTLYRRCFLTHGVRASVLGRVQRRVVSRCCVASFMSKRTGKHVVQFQQPPESSLPV